MERRETRVTRSWLGTLGGAAGAAAAALVAAWALKDGPGLGSVLFSVFLAVCALGGVVYAFIAGSAACPWCGGAISANLGSNSYCKCPLCGEYSEGEESRLWRIGLDRVAEKPEFAVSLYRPGEGPMMSPSVSLVPGMNVPMRSSEAVTLGLNWPSGCCVCGAPAAREEELARDVAQDKAAGLIQQIRTVRLMVPHCGEHLGGAALQISSAESGLAVKFRSYAYRNKFRDLNPSEAEPRPAAGKTEARAGSKVFSVANVRGGSLDLSAEAVEPWLSVRPARLSLGPGGRGEFEVSVDAASRPAGAAAGRVTLSGPGGYREEILVVLP